MQVIVNGILTNYTEVGSGKRIILFLHGWGDDGKTFEILANNIVKEDTKYTAILLDLAGFGGTESPPEAWGLDDYASFVSDFLRKIRLHPDVLVGHSNGGAIAIKGIADSILDPEKLILIASAGIRNSSLKKVLLKSVSVPARLALRSLPKSQRQRVRQKLYGAIGSDYLVVESMEDTFKRVVSTDVREAASTLTLPVCLIYGEKDDATPPAFGQRLAKAINGSEFNLIPSASHFVHQEQVYKVSSVIREFIK